MKRGKPPMDAETTFGLHRSKTTDNLKPFKTSLHQPADADADDAEKLPAHCRFKDLKEAGICSDYRQLARMVADENFPPGFLLSPNVRVWNIGEIRRWLAASNSRTTRNKKKGPPLRRAQGCVADDRRRQPSEFPEALSDASPT